MFEFVCVFLSVSLSLSGRDVSLSMFVSVYLCLNVMLVSVSFM